MFESYVLEIVFKLATNGLDQLAHLNSVSLRYFVPLHGVERSNETPTGTCLQMDDSIRWPGISVDIKLCIIFF